MSFVLFSLETFREQLICNESQRLQMHCRPLGVCTVGACEGRTRLWLWLWLARLLASSFMTLPTWQRIMATLSILCTVQGRMSKQMKVTKWSDLISKFNEIKQTTQHDKNLFLGISYDETCHIWHTWHTHKCGYKWSWGRRMSPWKTHVMPLEVFILLIMQNFNTI